MLRSLSKRERWGIYGASGAVCLFIFIQFILVPTLDSRLRLNRMLRVKTDTLSEMQRLRSEYERIVRRSQYIKQRFAGRKKGFTLFSFLDNLATDADIKENIAYMKPSSTVQKNGGFKISTIEMKVQSVTLPKLTDFLYRIETSRSMVSIKRASFIKKGKEKGAIEAILQVETFEL